MTRKLKIFAYLVAAAWCFLGATYQSAAMANHPEQIWRIPHALIFSFLMLSAMMLAIETSKNKDK